MNSRFFISLALGSLSTLSVWGWGQKGHDATAYIAEQHLTPATLEAVNKIFDGKSIVYYSNWLDNASHTPEYEYTKTWHYKNINSDETYETAERNNSGDVVKGIEKMVRELKSGNLTPEQQNLDLRILVHLVGDIHQPMHMGRKTDLGGNRHTLKYFGRNTNLHSIWDSSLPESAHNWSYTEWQQQVDRLSDDDALVYVEGLSPNDWGKETYQIASEIYATTPIDYNVSYDYIAKWAPVIENQFLKGGLRLADLLNSLFDPEYKSKSPLFVSQE